MAGRKRRPEAPPDGAGLRFAVVVAEFNAEITERLLEGALKALAEHGVAGDDVEVRWVPGAFELPLGARTAIDRGAIDGVVALGCVVRGETPHFDYVCRAATDGLLRVSLDTGVPVAFGVLTTEDFAQAEARAGGARGNKGYEAAVGAIEMALLRREPPR